MEARDRVGFFSGFLEACKGLLIIERE